MSGRWSRLRRWLVWLPPLAVMALIFVLSSQSGLQVSEDAAVDKPFRTSGHLAAYALLAATLLLALGGGQRPRPREVAVAFGLSVLYGLSDELHQSFVPDRTGRLDDVAVDALGALLGLAVAAVVLTIATWRRPADPRSS